MLTWIDEELELLKARQLYRCRREVGSAQGPTIETNNGSLLNFSSNDYLNLAEDPRLAQGASEAAERYGSGSGASPLVSGYLSPLQKLESALAAWEGTEAAMVFSSGFATNLAVVSAMAGPDDAIFSDELNHASLIDGSRLSKATTVIYRHLDMTDLRRQLDAACTVRRKWILSDSIFSMDGDQVPLDKVLDLADAYDSMVILDEAHATGVIGSHGRGVTDLYPEAMASGRIIKVGTLSKAIGAQGGFVCGSSRLIEWLVHKARPYIFSTALAPPLAGAALVGLDLIQREPQRRESLSELAVGLRQRLQIGGYDIGSSTCHIIPVVVGGTDAALRLSTCLQDQGILVPAIRPPTVPEGTARLRISLTCRHHLGDVERLVEALGKCQP